MHNPRQVGLFKDIMDKIVKPNFEYVFFDNMKQCGLAITNG